MRIYCLLLCLVSFLPELPAQVTTVAGTGCPSARVGGVSGTGQIGTAVSLRCSASRPRGAFVVAGVTRASAAFGPPLMCESGCVLGIVPLLVIPGCSVTVTIPNTPALVGQVLLLQAASQDGRGCSNYVLDPAVQVTVG